MAKKSQQVAKIKCLYCEKEFERKQHLIRHINTKHPAEKEKYNVCKYCPKAFKIEDKADFKKHHIDNKHIPENKIAQCDTCGQCFYTKYKLDQHVKNIHQKLDGNFNCTTCGKSYHTNQNLKTHKKNQCGKAIAKNSEKNVKCDKCDAHFSGKSDLKRHFTQVHMAKNNFKCQFCNKSFSNARKFKNHKNKEHGQIHECGKCEFQGNTQNALEEHIKSEHSTVCETCEKSFNDTKSLMKHIRIKHTTIIAHNCSKCDKEFECSVKLEDHIKTHHTCGNCHGDFNFLKKKLCPGCTRKTPDYKIKTFQLQTANYQLIKHVQELKSKLSAAESEIKSLKINAPFSTSYECDTCNHFFESEAACRLHYDTFHCDQTQPENVEYF